MSRETQKYYGTYKFATYPKHSLKNANEYAISCSIPPYPLQLAFPARRSSNVVAVKRSLASFFVSSVPFLIWPMAIAAPIGLNAQ